ncbi:MAG TPA: V-type ATP synthase subunit F [Spirochaetota bacterium]|nr:V-type ATP synthase subunit F [Spirochaetota bacterium]HPH03861.1 V-type ATP synthase subunit F [Spirochaetota bacterium]HPN83013.1 V-type ATP synthase subunit F [Spirochaetota bacterium]
MYRCLLIGDPDTAAAFALAGVVVRTPASQSEAGELFRDALADAETAVLVITENFAAALSGDINLHRQQGRAPLVIEIPENLSDSFGGRSLMESIRSAIGISIQAD